MDKNFERKIKDYFLKSKSKCYALKNWLNLNVKTYPFIEVLKCIYDFSDGNFSKMDDVIERLTNKNKVFGRTQVYGNANPIKMDIVRNSNGDLEIRNYDNAEVSLKGQKQQRNPKIFRKSDNQTNKLFKNTEEKLYDIGYRLRELFPNKSNTFLTFALQSVKKYSAEHKINPNKVLDAIAKKRVVFDDDFKIVRNNVSEGKIIVITENMVKELNETFQMSEYKFISNIKQFLSDLLIDPVTAKVPFILKEYGLNRYKLLNYLLKYEIIEKEESISDKDENGEPKTATMKIKFKVPKKNFNRKLKKLYIRLFERNIPEKSLSFDDENINEDGECCGSTSALSSGQYVQTVFPLQRRKSFNVDEDTTTNTVGDYQYTVPFIGDKETLSRKNGEGGSISINKL